MQLIADMHMHTVASSHAYSTVGEMIHAVTSAWLNIAGNPKVNVIGHSGIVGYEYDYDRVIPEFGREGKLVEMNEGTFTSRPDSVTNCVKIMRLCKKHRVPVIVDSDSHFYTHVGRCENCLRILKEIDFPEELVVNADVGRLREYLKRHTRVFDDPAAGPAL